MAFVSWYARDGAWHAATFPIHPLPDRKSVVRQFIQNIEAGYTVMRVSTSDASVHRLMLHVRQDQDNSFLWRPFIPYFGNLDFVKRIGIVRDQGRIVFNDPFPEFERSTFPHVDVVRPLSDHMRQSTMLSRWRELIVLRKEERARMAMMCLLKLARPDVVKVLHDGDWL